MIIFLDIDGVIATPKSYDTYEDLLDRDCIRALNSLTNRLNARIVISSTWRIEGYDHLKNMLGLAGVTAPIIALTPMLREETESGIILAKGRGAEILKWLEENKYNDDYVVIDDEIGDMKQLPQENLIHCKDGWIKGTGLTKELVDEYFKIKETK